MSQVRQGQCHIQELFYADILLEVKNQPIIIRMAIPGNSGVGNKIQMGLPVTGDKNGQSELYKLITAKCRGLYL